MWSTHDLDSYVTQWSKQIEASLDAHPDLIDRAMACGQHLIFPNDSFLPSTHNASCGLPLLQSLLGVLSPPPLERPVVGGGTRPVALSMERSRGGLASVTQILPPAIALALGVFAANYRRDPALPLKALGFFKDGDLPSLPKADQDLLRSARDGVSDVPEVRLLKGLLPVG